MKYIVQTVYLKYMGFWSQCQKNAINCNFGFGWRSFGSDTDTEFRSHTTMKALKIENLEECQIWIELLQKSMNNDQILKWRCFMVLKKTSAVVVSDFSKFFFAFELLDGWTRIPCMLIQKWRPCYLTEFPLRASDIIETRSFS